MSSSSSHSFDSDGMIISDGNSHASDQARHGSIGTGRTTSDLQDDQSSDILGFETSILTDVHKSGAMFYEQDNAILSACRPDPSNSDLDDSPCYINTSNLSNGSHEDEILLEPEAQHPSSAIVLSSTTCVASIKTQLNHPPLTPVQPFESQSSIEDTALLSTHMLEQAEAETSPQLHRWADESGDRDTTITERLEKSKWD